MMYAIVFATCGYHSNNYFSSQVTLKAIEAESGQIPMNKKIGII